MNLNFKSLILYVFQAVLILVPLTWTSATSELFEFPKMLITYAGAILITGLWAARMVSEKKLIFHRSPFEIPILIFLASQLISTLLSINPHTSLFGYYSRFNGGLLSLVAYLIFYFAAVSNFDRKDAKILINTLVFAAVISANYAFPEHFGHSPSCAMITGEFNASCWVQTVQFRVFGTFGQPNWLAAYLISIIFLPLAKIFNFQFPSSNIQSKQNQSKLFNIGAIGNLIFFLLFFLVLLFTKSRSGLLGFGVGMVVFTLRNFKKNIKQIIIAYLLLLVAFFSFGQNISGTTDKIISNFQFPISKTDSSPESSESSESSAPMSNSLDINITPSSDIRRIVWKGAWDLAKKYPLFGTGVETFAYSYYNVRPVEHNLVSEWDFLYNKAHNEFLNYAATTGFVGLGAYLIFLGSFIWWSLKTSRKSKVKSLSSTQKLPTSEFSLQTLDLEIPALLSGFIALCISNFFGFSTVPVNTLLFLFPALAFLLTDPLTHRLTDPLTHRLTDPLTHRLTGSSYLLYSIIALSTLILLLSVNRSLAADLAFAEGKTAKDNRSLQTAIAKLQQAVQLVPDEPVYLDELSLAASEVAASLAANNQLRESSEAAKIAVDLSNQTLVLNRFHTNFYKTRARMFINLSQVNPGFAVEAAKTLDAALQLAPTDAKLWFNRSLLTQQLGFNQEAVKIYQKTLELKPNYESARLQYGILLEELGKPEEAAAEYRYSLTNINPNNQNMIQALQRVSTASATP